MKIAPAQILLDKYRVERILGRGGMGIVAKVHHLVLDEPFAMKLLRHDLDRDDETIRRFVREARLTLKLKGEHVCRVYDVGILEDGAPYMIMEYLDGQDLGQYVKRHGRLLPELAVEFIAQACEALSEAHRLGIIHRDLKPANLYIARHPEGRPIVKVLDFGVSKFHSDVDQEATQNHTILGTPAYMSPEQLRSAKHVDERADIWALGVILYELLSGYRPFDGDSYSSLVLQVANHAVLPPPVPLPAGLAAIVVRCLAKVPRQRFQSVAELRAALSPYYSAQAMDAVPAPWPRAITGQEVSEPVSGPLNTPQGVNRSWSTLDSSMGQSALSVSTMNTRRRWSRHATWRFAGFALLCVSLLALIGVTIGVDDNGGSGASVGSDSGRVDAGVDGREPAQTARFEAIFEMHDVESIDAGQVMMHSGEDVDSHVDEDTPGSLPDRTGEAPQKNGTSQAAEPERRVRRASKRARSTRTRNKKKSTESVLDQRE